MLRLKIKLREHVSMSIDMQRFNAPQHRHFLARPTALAAPPRSAYNWLMFIPEFFDPSCVLVYFLGPTAQYRRVFFSRSNRFVTKRASSRAQ
jgi:hypothetical protein